MGTLTPIEAKREGWRDTVAALRAIADDLESGIEPECHDAVLITRSKDGEIRVFSFGQRMDDMRALAVLRLGDAVLVQGSIEVVGQ